MILDKKRLLCLEKRRELLISSNKEKGYIHICPERYLKNLLYLRKEIYKCYEIKKHNISFSQRDFEDLEQTKTLKIKKHE